MLEVKISPEAENDLLDTWLYIAEDQPSNAEPYLEKLHEKVQKLAEPPRPRARRSEVKYMGV